MSLAIDTSGGKRLSRKGGLRLRRNMLGVSAASNAKC